VCDSKTVPYSIKYSVEVNINETLKKIMVRAKKEEENIYIFLQKNRSLDFQNVLLITYIEL